jgi:hypothetical protein
LGRKKKEVEADRVENNRKGIKEGNKKSHSHVEWRKKLFFLTYHIFSVKLYINYTNTFFIIT